MEKKKKTQTQTKDDDKCRGKACLSLSLVSGSTPLTGESCVSWTLSSSFCNDEMISLLVIQEYNQTKQLNSTEEIDLQSCLSKQ